MKVLIVNILLEQVQTKSLRIKDTLRDIFCSMQKVMIYLSLLTVCSSSFADKFVEQSVKITALDGFVLSAQLVPGAKGAAGVLLLHDCQHSAENYSALYAALSQQGLHVLALDLRGYGRSQNGIYSQVKIRQQADDIVGYQGELAALMLHWRKDVFKAFQYLKTQMKNNQTISIVTSGCSSNQAIYLAEKTAIKSIVMLSPELSYGDKEQFKTLADMPIYLISAKHQTEAMLNTQELFDWNGDAHSMLQVLKGDASSYYLLKHQPYLNDHIATWLSSTLINKE